MFVVGAGILAWHGAKNHKFSLADFYRGNYLIIISLSILLVGVIFHQKIGNFATGVFIGAAFLHFLCNGKFYQFNRLFFFLFLYAILLLAGTIGTEKGFHFPDITLSFYLLPLSLCFFRLSRETLLRIGRFFFRVMIIYMLICVIYWWFNFLYLDTSFSHWVTHKLYFPVEMNDWVAQTKKCSDGYFAAFFFVNSWAYYYHPSYISLVLFFGLITGFYLYYKKNALSVVTRFELILYIVLCFVSIILMESRVGFVGFLFILAVTGLYYFKLKTRYFKIVLPLCLLLGISALFLLNDKISEFADDELRATYQILAIDHIKEHFWWGCGFHEQKAALVEQAQKINMDLPHAIEPRHTHNQFLGDMVEYGIWGLLALTSMLCAFARYAVKKRSYLLQMLLCVTVLLMFVDEPLYIQEGVTRFTVFLIFFVAVSESSSDEENILRIKKNTV
jgi:hypothetical protein